MTAFTVTIDKFQIKFWDDVAAAHAWAEENDAFAVSKPEDMIDMTGFQMVETYNAAAKELGDTVPVKKFSTKEDGTRRVLDIVGALREKRVSKKPEKAEAGPKKPRKLADKIVPHGKEVHQPKDGTVAAKLLEVLSDWVDGDVAAQSMNDAALNEKVWTASKVFSSAVFQLCEKKGYGVERIDGKLRITKP